jgi:hypothetical protein
MYARILIIVSPNDQLTDGGPSAAREPANRVAGPPFGGAVGSALLGMRTISRIVDPTIRMPAGQNVEGR